MRRLSAIILAQALALALSAILYAQSWDHTVFQASTYHALKEGILDGDTSFGELRKHGDFGLGTLNGLDGEMVALNGEFFQIKSDSSVHLIPDDDKSPFAVVTFFRSDKKISLPQIKNFKELQDTLDRLQIDRDSILAIKAVALFERIKLRSPRKQPQPYPPLEEALKSQAEFELNNLKGTLVGFRFPKYMDGVNVPGDHLHFISTDKKAGGHIMDCVIESADLQLEVISNLSVKF